MFLLQRVCLIVQVWAIRMTTLGNETLLSPELAKRIINIIIADCPCHIFHNASTKASNTFNNVTGFNIYDHSIDFYHLFDKSSKRKCALKEYYDIRDLEYADIIKFISTRWLWLQLRVNRELKKYSGLKCYFRLENFADRSFKRLQTSFNDSNTEVYLLFYQAVCHVLPTSINSLNVKSH